jgi:hypothetical protein
MSEDEVASANGSDGSSSDTSTGSEEILKVNIPSQKKKAAAEGEGGRTAVVGG